MRILYFDCFSGAAGDMILGALLDAGLPFDELRTALVPLLPAGAEIVCERVTKAGVAATKFRLLEHSDDRRPKGTDHFHPELGHHHDYHDPDAGHAQPDPGHDQHDHHHHHHDHTHHDHPSSHSHHTLPEIHALIEKTRLSPQAKRHAHGLFDRLAEAEATIHQVPVDRVHLHEVGALDSIVDIVGAVFALEWVGADRVVSSALNVGGGTVRCAHGVLPVPAPATLRLLQGVPVYSSGVEAELVTPTGALLITGHADSFGPMPAMRIERVGYGAGDRDLPGRPNVLRVLVGNGDSHPQVESLLMLECEIDDMNPQLFGLVMDRLHEAGAVDVFFTPVQMKKNRPGTLVTVLAPPDRREALSAIMFHETTTIGLRWQTVERERLDREIVNVETPYGAARIKVAKRAGKVVNLAPEFDDCVRLASGAGIAVKEAQALVMKAYLDKARQSGFGIRDSTPTDPAQSPKPRA